MAPAFAVHIRLGDMWEGRGDVDGEYFKNGLNRWIYWRWKNELNERKKC
jgi:hypothetical protein